MEVARRVRAGERRSDVESELTSDDPMDLDDMIFSDEEESREVAVTSAERHDPTVASAGEEQEAAWRVEVPVSRKRAASVDVVGEWVAKRTRSSCPSVALPAPSSPVADVARQARRSKERAGTCAAMGPVPTPDLRPEEAPPTMGAVKQSKQSKGQTGARSTRDSWSKDAPPAAPIGEPRARGRSDP